MILLCSILGRNSADLQGNSVYATSANFTIKTTPLFKYGVALGGGGVVIRFFFFYFFFSIFFLVLWCLMTLSHLTMIRSNSGGFDVFATSLLKPNYPVSGTSTGSVHLGQKGGHFQEGTLF